MEHKLRKIEVKSNLHNLKGSVDVVIGDIHTVTSGYDIFPLKNKKIYLSLSLSTYIWLP